MTETINNKKMPKYAYVIVVCIFISVFIADYSSYQMPPLSHLIIPELKINDAEFARLFAAGLIPGVLFCLISGLLCDKFGTKRVIGIGIAVTALGVIARVFFLTYVSLYISLFLIGVTATFISSNIPKIIVSWVPPNKVGLMVGICISGGPVAMTIAMSTTALFPSIKAAFAASAILSVLVLIAWSIFMREHPKEKIFGKIYSEEIQNIPLMEGLKTVIKKKNIWLVGICSGLILSTAISTSTFLPRALQLDKGIDAAASGAVTSFIMIGNIVGSILGPMICMRIGKMRPFLFVSCLVMALGIAFSWKYFSGVTLSICLFLTGVAGASALSLFTSVVVLFKGVGPQIAGTAGGFACTIRMLLCTLLPSYVIAPLANENYTILFFLAGLAAVLAGIISLKIPDVYTR